MYGSIVPVTLSIAVGGSITSAYDLGRAWDKVWLVIPTMSAYVSTTTCNVFIWAAPTSSDTFFQVAHPVVNSATSGFNTFTIANSVSQCVIPIPNGMRYLKVQTGNTITAAVDFKIICSS